ncbi:heme-binding domain-containing protein, partial [Sulfuricurvum sp.]|uniref:heme-binding domain-containing protein n=1 Tax=Sulfuricurvum sp. TaxID=2025608 RepID=UPI003BB6E8C1
MKKIAFWVLGIAIAIQLIRPDFQNTKVDETVVLKADAKVMSILNKSCYDCHSQETLHPWYSNIAPISWVMADHINQGRKAIDFSNWENINPKLKL